MNITVAIEPMGDVLNDPRFGVLSREYAADGVEELVDADWAVDHGRYMALGESGLLKVFALRADGHLVGFLSLSMAVSLHTSKPLALVESIFVEAAFRPYATRLIAAVKRYARERGFSYISFSAPAGSRLDRLLSVQARRGRAKCVYHIYLERTEDAARFDN